MRDDLHELPTPRTTLQSRYVRVLVWCTSCRLQRDAALQALIDAGKGDEYYLDLGAQAFAEELSKIGAAHTIELFDGKHGGITYRYPGAIRELVLALR